MPKYVPDTLEHVAAHLTDDNGNSLDLAAGIEVIVQPGSTVDVPAASATAATLDDVMVQLRAIRIGFEKLLAIQDPDLSDVDLVDEAAAELGDSDY